MNSREKGRRGELELCEELRQHGFTARRTQQYCGAAGDGDVVVTEWPHLHIEAKRRERLDIAGAMEQAARDGQGKVPTVMHRRNRTPWLVTLALADFIKLTNPPHA